MKRSVLYALALGWLVYAAFFASTGIYTVDELIYGSMIERFTWEGSFVIPNGYESHPSSSLRLPALVPTPDGLVPQYPAGYAIVAAPFFLVGGLQAVVFLNALASVALLALTYLLARRLFGDVDLALNAALILGLASFLIEYALGIWPHALGALFVTLAAYLAALSLQEGTRATAHAALAGLILGLGVNIRVDVFLGVPAIALWLLGNFGFRTGVAPFVTGLAPGLAIASWLNYLKFGLASPLTYGHDDLGEAAHLLSVDTHADLLPLALLAGAVAVAFGFRPFRELFLGWRGLLLTIAALALAVALPGISQPSMKIIRGLYVLLLDLQSYDYIERQSGVVRTDEGALLFWGVAKKALFVSLPFLGLLLLPLAKVFRRGDRAAYALCFLCPMSLFVFFALNQWHGGLSNNMRYFLPALPFLAIIAADAWHEISPAKLFSNPAVPTIGIMALTVVACFSIAIAASGRTFPTAAVLFLSQASQLVFGLLLLLSTLYLCRPYWREPLKRVISSTMLVGFAAAFFWGYLVDAVLSQTLRSARHDLARAFSRIESNALVVAGEVGPFYFQLQRDDAPLSRVGRRDGPDVDLVQQVLTGGRSVYVYPQALAETIAADLGPAYAAEPVADVPAGLYRLKRLIETGLGS